MKLAPFLYLNGRVVRSAQARISPLDRGFLYGDGAFESMRAMEGTILEWDAHARRLYESAKRLGIPLGRRYPEEKLARGLRRLLRRNRLRNAMVRLSVTRGAASTWGLSFKNAKGPPTVAAFAVFFKGYSDAKYERGASLWTSTIRMILPEAIPPTLKSLNYLGNVLAAEEAARRGADEALLLTAEGLVAEGARSNLFWVRKEVVYTPSLDTGILPGITRARATALARAMGFEVREVEAKRKALDRADEIFYTNSSSWTMPVTRLDGRRVGPPAGAGSKRSRMGPVCRLLLTAFRAHYAEEAGR
jgi:branched-chain amino acid aminotransferase